MAGPAVLRRLDQDHAVPGAVEGAGERQRLGHLAAAEQDRLRLGGGLAARRREQPAHERRPGDGGVQRQRRGQQPEGRHGLRRARRADLRDRLRPSSPTRRIRVTPSRSGTSTCFEPRVGGHRGVEGGDRLAVRRARRVQVGLPLQQRVVDADQAAASQQPAVQQRLEVAEVTGLVGVEEDEVEALPRRRQLAPASPPRGRPAARSARPPGPRRSCGGRGRRPRGRARRRRAGPSAGSASAIASAE